MKQYDNSTLEKRKRFGNEKISKINTSNLKKYSKELQKLNPSKEETKTYNDLRYKLSRLLANY